MKAQPGVCDPERQEQGKKILEEEENGVSLQMSNSVLQDCLIGAGEETVATLLSAVSNWSPQSR